MNRLLFLFFFLFSCLFQFGCSSTSVVTKTKPKEPSLEEWLAMPIVKRPLIYDELFSTKNSSKKDIIAAKKLLFEDIKAQRLEQLQKS